MGILDSITESFGNLKKKITGVAADSTPSPLASSNAMTIQGGGKRSRSRRRRMRSGSKRRSHKKRKSVKKVRFSKKNKVYMYRRK
jgi:hypothetical protein